MRILQVDQVDEITDLIGEACALAVKERLANGTKVWFFRTVEEVEADAEISGEQKTYCRKRFVDGHSWAGIFVDREPVYIPGISVHPDYDTHGNRRNRNPGPPTVGIH